LREDQGRRPNGLGFAFGELLDKAPLSVSRAAKGLCSRFGPTSSGSLTPTMLRGPAPKSRFAVTGLFVYEDQRQIKSRSTAGQALRICGSELAHEGAGTSIGYRVFWIEHSRASSLPQRGVLPAKMSAPELASSRLKPVPLKAPRTPVGPASAGKPLICFKCAFDLHTQDVQTTQNATWALAERRRRAVGRAAWMRRERRQDRDVRSARAHGASSE
jgi:hypothetical protein